MENLRKLLEIAVNIAVVLVAVLVGSFLIDRYNAPSSQPPVEIQPKQGTKLQIKDVDFSKSDRNLMLVLSTSCHYCAESIPFYQRLAVLNADAGKLRIIGAFMQDTDASVKYLKEHDLAIDDVIEVDATEIMVRGTPTLILTDRNGVVLDSWYGKVKPERENEVVDRVFSDAQPVVN